MSGGAGVAPVRVRHAVFLPPFGELADPRRCAALAASAEEHGWDGFFLWDHVLRPDPPMAVADPWVTLAAVAVATERIRLGPMITPIVRRRPQKLAREVTTLDQLSGGRLILGLGLGVDTGRELSGFGELVDPLERGDLLDEGIELLRAMWSGERVEHHGEHFVADGVVLLPRPTQLPYPPIWMAARTTAARPLRRAARQAGLFVIEVDAESLSGMLELIRSERGTLDGYDVAAVRHGGIDASAYETAGVTWWMTDVAPGVPAADVSAMVAAGPPS